MEPKEQPEGDGFYFATLRSNGERMPVRVIDGFVRAFNGAEWNIKHFTDYAPAIDPLAESPK